MKTNVSRATPLVIVIAVAAVLLSLTGGAVAAGLVTSAQIQNNSVQSKDIRNGTIKVTDLSSSARLQLAGQDGQDGVDGAPGTNGTNGINGVSGYERVSATGPSVGVGVNTSVTLACPVGKKIIGTGSEFVLDYEGTSVQITSDTSATAYGINLDAPNDNIRIHLICASIL